MMLHTDAIPLSGLKADEFKSEEPPFIAACPLCDCHKMETVVRHSDFEGVFVYRCMNCNHHFAHPEPDPNQITVHYSGAYRRHRFGPSYCELMKRRAAAQVQFIRRSLMASGGSFAKWKVCDIGCGIGALVAQFEREGALAKGYDLDPNAIRFGKKHWKLDLHVGGLEGVPLSTQDLDLLCLSHVIEHLQSLQSSLEKAVHGLRDGRYLFVEVPRYHEKTFQPPLDLESHLHFFTSSSLTALLERVGLSVIISATCGPTPQMVEGKGHCSVSMFRLIWNRVLCLLKQTHHIRTLYDGFFETYGQAPEAGGIWIRCLAKKKGEEHGSARPHPC